MYSIQEKQQINATKCRLIMLPHQLGSILITLSEGNYKVDINLKRTITVEEIDNFPDELYEDLLKYVFWDPRYNIEVSRIDPKDMSLDKVLVQNWLNYARDHSLFGFKFENGWDATDEVIDFNKKHETKFTFFGLNGDDEEDNFDNCRGCTWCGECDFCDT